MHVSMGMGRPAYSIFEGTTTDDETVASLLDSLQITDIDVAGIATDYCVRESALHALESAATPATRSARMRTERPDSIACSALCRTQ